MLYIGCGALLLLFSYLLYRQITVANRRRELTTRLRMRLEEIKQAESAFNSQTHDAAGYFAQYTLRTWKQRYDQLFADINGVPYQATDLSSLEKATIQSFLDYHQRGEELRLAYNTAFIPAELERFDHLFSHIEGRSLDVQQRTAIVSDEDNSLVVAGAGSGKTTTIVGKVKYVLERYRTSPDNILLISFTNKSASTLAERIGIEGMKPKTFHKFGKDIICAVDGRQPSLYDEQQFGSFITSVFQQLAKDPAYAKKVTTYFLRYLKPVKAWGDFPDQGAYIQHLKDNNFRSYKSIERSVNGKVTYKQEVVKSVEECRIANFLLFHGVEYQYEAPYEHATASSQHAQWKPDFTIQQDDKTVYLEHFGVDREGNVPHFFAKKGQSVAEAGARYRSKMEWARQTSQAHGTTLVESYSYEMDENVLFVNLRDNLTQQGIVLHLKTPIEMWNIISDAAADEVTSFTSLLQTFITLMKSNDFSIEDIRRQNAHISDEPQQQRNLRFVELVAPIYERYQQELAKRQELDFSDLINRATEHIKSGKYRQAFDYIIIDEFQDISQSRYRLIQALKNQNPHCKLFCVGDDWQSIYRFAGSDMSLFKHFPRYFGHTVKSKIETTYRFHEPLIQHSSTFITQNPNQVQKTLKSGSTGKSTDYRIVYNPSEEQDNTGVLQQILDELIVNVPGIDQKELLLLGRYSFDLKRIKNTNRTFTVDSSGALSYAYQDEQGNRATLHLQFLTVHKSKGLEADIVILLNCNSGKLGFPSEMSDDPVLGLVLSEADQFENGEERRLFYVALTRAKEQVILVTDSAFKSKFITELEAKIENVALKKCPVCISADMVKRSGTSNGKQWAFYGCSNYAYGCEYREWIR
ncbi:UvrD-helicase domain-containing protein [Hymenobacter actinosclerus]|uniref:DNA 3'-5' helicase n=1 Tax=Hymenobacter actinosclerus TaxID=82805 RepID=A0A1I0IS60_9BACT|nr:UvrD-helicase domain-containing protein [Hymenobacter actinosclerus]SET99348.1 DNA helicase-4 [Hymenobacter actinosclerus]